MSNSIRIKFFWPDIKRDVKKTVAAYLACQIHDPSQQREPNRLALQYVDNPMQSVGIDFFEMRGRSACCSWIASAGCKWTDLVYLIKQLKR